MSRILYWTISKPTLIEPKPKQQKKSTQTLNQSLRLLTQSKFEKEEKDLRVMLALVAQDTKVDH